MPSNKTAVIGAAFSLLTICPLLAQEPSLTIYNQNFAVIRETVKLNLKPGVNKFQYPNVTAQVEPDSVVLRDPSGKHKFQILEQNYLPNSLSQELLLFLNEGKTIDFLTTKKDTETVVRGKIIRSGYVPAQARPQYYDAQAVSQGPRQPIIEVNGEVRFGLPGQPLFPALPADAVLKPTLEWLLDSGQADEFDAELGYISNGLGWHADYNIVSPEKGDLMDLAGWVTLTNQSGRDFNKARVQLMAGDVNKVQPNEYNGRYAAMSAAKGIYSAPAVNEKPFDEYHLYTLKRPVSVNDRDTKQIEFVRAQGVRSQKLYIYDGMAMDGNRYQGYSLENIRSIREYGTQSNPKVWVMRTFQNSTANHLGIPLPKGRIRFYTKNDDGQLEFVGENNIDHTPADETIRVFTGNSFDIVGERRQTQFALVNSNNGLNEAFEIKLRNHKKERVQVRVVEHLYRWTNWEIVQKSDAYEKTDSRTIEFPVDLKPGEEKTVTYFVYYSW